MIAITLDRPIEAAGHDTLLDKLAAACRQYRLSSYQLIRILARTCDVPAQAKTVVLHAREIGFINDDDADVLLVSLGLEEA